MLAFALLGACVTPPTTVDLGAGAFLVSGKLAVRAPEGNWSARFRWVQDAAVYDIELWGPFGQGRTRLRGDALRMRVLDGRGQVITAGTPAAIMQQELGTQLPLLSLVHWAQGRPDPEWPVASGQRDASGRYVGFEQSGWQVRLASYTETSDGARPQRLEAENGPYRATVLFNRWQAANGV